MPFIDPENLTKKKKRSKSPTPPNPFHRHIAIRLKELIENYFHIHTKWSLIGWAKDIQELETCGFREIDDVLTFYEETLEYYKVEIKKNQLYLKDELRLPKITSAGNFAQPAVFNWLSERMAEDTAIMNKRVKEGLRPRQLPPHQQW